MKIRITLLFIFFSAIQPGFSQSISPLTTAEYCPNTDVVFTVTLPLIYSGTTPGVAGWTNAPLVTGPVSNITNSSDNTKTTFNFTGRFLDKNINQVFRISYTTDGTTTSYYEASFKNIKSLFYNFMPGVSSCQGIMPNQASIDAPLCQTPNRTVSFNNISWNTYGENPTYCFGTITTYEYQIPAGWSIGSIVSTGSNWIPGGNNVTLTADQSTGNGMTVKIRPSNNCGASLTNGQVPVQIPITRSGPPLTLSGSTILCSGTNYTFTIGGVPTGASVAWVSNGYYQLTPNGTSATVSPYASSSALTTVKANVTPSGCSLTFPVSTSVNIGVPYTGFNIESYPEAEPNCYSIETIYEFRATVTYGPPATGFQWGYRMASTPGDIIYPYNSPYFTLIPSTADDYEIFVKPVSTCGVGTNESVKDITVLNYCAFGSSAAISTYPNPATDEVIVSLPAIRKDSRKLTISTVEMELIDIIRGTVVKKWTLPAGQNNYRLNVSSINRGAYLLRIRTGDQVTKRKLLIAK